MIRSLRAGTSGLKSNQVRMDVTGNNIANVNTIAFKRSRTAFNEMLGQQLLGVGRTAGGTGINPSFVGLGVSVSSIDKSWSQGALETTNVATDVALNGDGFFVARRGEQQLLTRAGNFTFNRNGEFVTANGLNVQGWAFNDDGTQALAGLKDITIDPNALVPAKATGHIRLGGNLSAETAVGESTVISTTAYDNQGEAHPVVIDMTRIAKMGEDGATSDTWRWVARDKDGNLLSHTSSTPNTPATGTFSGTVTPAATGDVLNDETYSFEVTSGGTVGTDDITLSWQSASGAKGKITIPASYAGTTPIAGPDNVGLTFTVGDALGAGESFNFDTTAATDAITYPSSSNTVTAPTLAASAAYTGQLDNTYRFTVESGGAVNSADIELRWYDDFGNTGTVTIPSSYDSTSGDTIEGPEGIDLQWTNGDTLDFGTFFSVDVVGVGQEVSFDASGQLETSADDRDETFNFEWDMDGDGPKEMIDINFGGGEHTAISQSSGSMTANVLEQDGYTAGAVTGYSINPEGILNLNFSNGVQKKLYQMAIGNVTNPNGLEQFGENFYTTSMASGDLQLARAGRDSQTAIVSGAIEMSNVDLATEFTDMITTQRAFQAAARVITTSDEMLQETVTLKR